MIALGLGGGFLLGQLRAGGGCVRGGGAEGKGGGLLKQNWRGRKGELLRSECGRG